ncbi:MAG: hypothetical protein ACTSUE_12300 [Promethearchaeota archaeon]
MYKDIVTSTHDLKCLELLHQPDMEKCLGRAYISIQLEPSIFSGEQKYLLVGKGGRTGVLKPEVLPAWMPLKDHKIIRVHPLIRKHLCIRLGEFCRVQVLDGLPELESVSVKLVGSGMAMHKSFSTGIKKYLIDKPIQEKSEMSLPMGFTHLDIKLVKTFPFSRGIIGKNTHLQITT